LVRRSVPGAAIGGRPRRGKIGGAGPGAGTPAGASTGGTRRGRQAEVDESAPIIESRGSLGGRDMGGDLVLHWLCGRDAAESDQACGSELGPEQLLRHETPPLVFRFLRRPGAGNTLNLAAGPG